MTSAPGVARRGAALRLVVIALALASPAAAEPAGADTSPKTWRYLVGAGDVLSVSMWAGDTERSMNLTLTVAGDGTLDVPQVGRIQVGGMAAQDIGALIERRLREGGYYKSPHVAVNIEKYQSQCVNVTGFVAVQGRYCLERETRLLDMLARAGGVVEDAAGDVVLITRAGATAPIEILRSVLTGTDLDAARRANIVINADDNIYVPKKDENKIHFCIYGAVKKADCYDQEGRVTLAEALARGGGVEQDRADPSKVAVVRKKDGTRTSFVVDAGESGPGGQGFAIENGDEITVPEIELVVWVSGAVSTEGPVPWRTGMVISDAVSKAGAAGAGESMGYAKLSKVILRREGEPIRYVNVKAILHGKADDIPVLPGDRIHVERKAF